MQYYFAPLEGLTDSVYRNLHHKYFPGVDRYYTPFFSPTVHRQLTPKEARELPPAQCVKACVIPQLLTKVAEDFTWMAQQCKDLGYTGIDYNISVMQKNPAWIKQSQALGLTVNVWTVNDTERIQWCIDQKVDYITTDNPEEVNRLLGK